jgi:hypothetical protein
MRTSVGRRLGSRTSVGDRETAESRRSGWTGAAALGRAFRDDPRGAVTWWVVAALLTLSVLGGLLRTGFLATLDSAWAEDGRDFLAASLRDGPVASLLEPYAGYGHLVPRILSGIASIGPLTAASAVIAVESALVVGLLALVVYRASAGHVPDPRIRFLLAAFVALQPVAHEVLLSLANLQWYLLFAAFVVLLWSGSRPSHLVVAGVLCFLTAASSPFGALLLPFAVLRVVVLRTRSAWIAPAALAAGFVLQTWVMLHAPERGLTLMTSPFRLGAWYLGHVLAPVVFGERLTGDDLTARSLVLGVLALAVCAVLWRLASRRARTDMLPVLVCTVVFSVLVYLGPTVVGGIAAPRYGVPAALALAFGIAVLLAQVLEDRRVGQVPRRQSTWVLGVGAVIFVCWAISLPAARAAGPSWSQEVRDAVPACESASATSVVVPVSPAGWTAQLPCARVVAQSDR